MVQPGRPDQVVRLHRHQNPCINTAAIRIECLQPIDGRQVEAGIAEGHQLPVDQIPVTFGLGHGIFGEFDGVLCSGSDLKMRPSYSKPLSRAITS